MSDNQPKKKKDKRADEMATRKLASESATHKTKLGSKATSHTARRVTLKIEDGQVEKLSSPQATSTAPSQASATMKLFENLSNLNTPLANQDIPDDQDPIKKLARAIREARAESRMTQKELARVVGVDTSFIAHLETLKESGALPSYSRSQALERALGFQNQEIWVMVENARALMAWKRMRVQEELRVFELAEQGITVPTATQEAADFTYVLSEEVSAQDLIETLSDLLKIINDPSKRDDVRALLRAHADHDDSPEAQKA